MDDFDTSPSAFIPEGLSEADYRELTEVYNRVRRRLRSPAESIANELFKQIVRGDRSVDFAQLRSASAPTADIEDSLEKLNNLVSHTTQIQMTCKLLWNRGPDCRGITVPVLEGIGI